MLSRNRVFKQTVHILTPPVKVLGESREIDLSVAVLFDTRKQLVQQFRRHGNVVLVEDRAQFLLGQETVVVLVVETECLGNVSKLGIILQLERLRRGRERGEGILQESINCCKSSERR